MPNVVFDKAGASGLILDQKAHAIPMDAWSNAQNIRFNRGRAMRFSGDQAVFGTPTVDPYWLQYWSDSQEIYWFYANAAKVYRTDGSSHINVTNAGGDYSAGANPKWNGGVLGGVPIINNSIDPPQQWDSGTTKFKDLDNWPSGYTCAVMRPYKQFLVALDITQSGTRYPTKVLWSHEADPGTVPVSWDITDPTMDAGEASLSESTGFLVDCLPLGDMNVLYKEDGTWFMRHTGSAFVFQFAQAFRGYGILAQNCVAEFQRRHFVVGIGDIWIHDGQTAKSVIEEKLRDYFYSNLDPTYYVNTFVVANYVKNEIWVCFPETGQQFPSKALVWNWNYETWTVRALTPGTSFGAFGNVDLSGVSDTYDGSSGTTYDADSGVFGERSYNPTVQRLITSVVGSSKSLRVMDEGNSIGGSGIAFLERTGLPIVGQNRQGEPIVDVASVKFVRAVYPNIVAEAGTTIQISVGKQDFVDGEVTWYGPFSFVPGQDLKVDCTVSGRLIAIRFETSQDTRWELQRYSLDLDVVGIW